MEKDTLANMGEGVKPPWESKSKSVSDSMPWKPGVKGVERGPQLWPLCGRLFLTDSIKEPPVPISDAGDLKKT